jgi:hypothetical protein
MAGFEVVVRPVVFPNIRPASPRVLPPEDDPEQGIAVIGGSGGRSIDLAHSWSFSLSRQRPHHETKRQFDKERVYQVDEDGKINKENFVEVERMKKIRLDNEDESEEPIKMEFEDPPPADNIETLETDVTRDIGTPARIKVPPT